MLLWKIDLIEDTAQVPTKATHDSANYDLYASEEVCLMPGDTKLVSLGIRSAIPTGNLFEVYSRSGLSLKGLVVNNAPGQIDADYRGIWKVMMHNQTSYPYVVKIGDRIAQGRVVPVHADHLSVAYIDPDETTRGEGGFGSTGD